MQLTRVTIPSIQLLAEPKSAAPVPPPKEAAPTERSENPIAVTTVAAKVQARDTNLKLIALWIIMAVSFAPSPQAAATIIIGVILATNIASMCYNPNGNAFNKLIFPSSEYNASTVSLFFFSLAIPSFTILSYKKFILSPIYPGLLPCISHIILSFFKIHLNRIRFYFSSNIYPTFTFVTMFFPLSFNVFLILLICVSTTLVSPS